MIIAFVIVLVFIIYLFCLWPNTRRRKELAVFEKTYIAHRGLFDNSKNVPENSITAFKLAVEAGYGIELDVQLTTDDKLVVFHDASLSRMCGVDKNLFECSFEEIQQYCLANTTEKIPLFEDVLKVIDCKVPLIIEVKPEGRYIETTKKMCEMIEKYNGVFCMESFHPLSVAWVRKNYPEIIRGQLSTDFFKDEPKRKFSEKFVLSNLLLNFHAKPDFIAYNHFHKNQFSYRLCRKLFPVVNVAWTIKNQSELTAAKKTFSVIIFDGFIPDSM